MLNVVSMFGITEKQAKAHRMKLKVLQKIIGECWQKKWISQKAKSKEWNQGHPGGDLGFWYS